MLVVLYLCIGLGIHFIFFSFFFRGQAEAATIASHFDLRIKSLTHRHSFGSKFLDILGYINIPLLKISGLNPYYARLINKAGLGITPFAFFAVKELAAFFSFTLLSLLNLNLGVRLIFLASLGGFFLPDLWLLIRAKAYQEKLLRVLPETVDLLSLCISAGLDFMGAIRWISEGKIRFKSPLTKELVRVKEEVNLGKFKSQALEDMEKRLDMREISSLVRTLVLSEKLGISISDALDNFSTDSREKRFHKGERKARMAAIKILFPLIFFILPTIGIIIVGPILLQFMQQGMLKF